MTSHTSTNINTQDHLFVQLLSFLLADMHRTFPDNVLFKSKAEPSLQRALYNVLLAYGHHNMAVGYCQVKIRVSSHCLQACLPKEQDWLVPYLPFELNKARGNQWVH